MFFRAAALFLAIASLAAPARAADASAAHWKYDNPFCQVVAAVAPLPDVVASVTPVTGETRYEVTLYAAEGATLGAHVTLVSDTDAYDAAVPAGTLSGPSEDRRSEPVIVTLPAPDAVTYYFVDSYALDGTASVTCPSYVFEVGEGLSNAPGGVLTVGAQHLQAIGKLACGHVYQPPSSRGDMGGMIGNYGNKPLTVELQAYIDSKGHALQVKTVRSSGVAGVDDNAIGEVQQEEFHPAQFLCTPVVSEIRFRMEYQP